jgi:leucyl-tRNA synthetase
MVCKETVACPAHGFLFPDETDDASEERLCRKCGGQVTVGRVEKMSKSKKNVIDPNVLLERYGADTTRLFCLFAAPPERDLEWSEQGVEGAHRFLNRVWRLFGAWEEAVREAEPSDGKDLEGDLLDLYRKTHGTIKKVTNDIEERFHFNTAISAVMELVNQMNTVAVETASREAAAVMKLAMEATVKLLSPMVPHFAEELWRATGHQESVLLAEWPVYEESALKTEEMLIVVQVNGKLRGRFTIEADAGEEAIKERALADEQVRKFIEGKPIRKVIVVKNKLVNIVV